MTEDLKGFIAGHRFFSGMSERHLTLLTGCARPMEYGPGEFLCREGEPAEHFYVLLAGRVAVETHAPPLGTLALASVGAGEVLGADWLVEGTRRSFDYRAMEPSRALKMDGRCLRGEFPTDHELGYQLMLRFSRLLAHTLRATRLQLLEVIHEHAAE